MFIWFIYWKTKLIFLKKIVIEEVLIQALNITRNWSVAFIFTVLTNLKTRMIFAIFNFFGSNTSSKDDLEAFKRLIGIKSYILIITSS